MSIGGCSIRKRVRLGRVVHVVASLPSCRASVFVFGLAVVIRLICLSACHTWRFPDQWSFGYEIGYLGRSLTEGHGFAFSGIPTAKFPPVYPLLVAGAFAALGSYSTLAAVALLLFQSVCAALAAVCVALVGSRLYGRNVGLIAGVMWAVYPGSIINSVGRVWYSEFSILLVLLLVVIATGSREHIALRVVCFGGIAGLLALTDPTMLTYAGLLFLWMLHRLELAGARQWIGWAAVCTVIFALMVAPWAVRNYRVFGTPTFVKSSFGLELFLGNNPYSTGGEVDEERRKALASVNDAQGAYYQALSENAYFDYLGRRALDWIRAHPGRFAQLCATRFWHFWGKFPSSGPEMWSTLSAVQLTWYVPTALLALCGLFLCIRRRLDFLPLWLFFVVYPVPYYVTHVQLYRYRYPVEPFLIVLAALPVSIWCARIVKQVTFQPGFRGG